MQNISKDAKQLQKKQNHHKEYKEITTKKSKATTGDTKWLQLETVWLQRYTKWL